MTSNLLTLLLAFGCYIATVITDSITDGICQCQTATDDPGPLVTAAVVTGDVSALTEASLIPPTLDIVHQEVAVLHPDGCLHTGGLDDDDDDDNDH